MERVVRDPALRMATAEKGRQRARFFSWQRAAAETLRVYQELLGVNDEIPNLYGEEAAILERPR
jgi:hypothetical protein